MAIIAALVCDEPPQAAMDLFYLKTHQAGEGGAGTVTPRAGAERRAYPARATVAGLGRPVELSAGTTSSMQDTAVQAFMNAAGVRRASTVC